MIDAKKLDAWAGVFLLVALAIVFFVIGFGFGRTDLIPLSNPEWVSLDEHRACQEELARVGAGLTECNIMFNDCYGKMLSFVNGSE